MTFVYLAAVPAAVTVTYGVGRHPPPFVGVGVATLAILGIVVAAAVFVVAMLVLTLLAFKRIRSGFSLLASTGKVEASLGSTGVLLVLVGAVIALASVALGIALLPLFYLIWVGVVVAVIGYILIGIGLFQVGSHYQNGLLEAGGILVAIPVMITSFIGLILSYVALGEVESKLRSQPQGA